MGGAATGAVGGCIRDAFFGLPNKDRIPRDGGGGGAVFAGNAGGGRWRCGSSFASVRTRKVKWKVRPLCWILRDHHKAT